MQHDDFDFETIKNFLKGELKDINDDLQADPGLSKKISDDTSSGLDNKKDCITSLLHAIEDLGSPVDDAAYIKHRDAARESIMIYLEARKVEDEKMEERLSDPYSHYEKTFSQIRNNIFSAYNDEPAHISTIKPPQHSQSDPAKLKSALQTPPRRAHSMPASASDPVLQKKQQNNVPQERMFALSKSPSTLFTNIKSAKPETKIPETPLIDRKKRRRRKPQEPGKSFSPK